LQSLKAAGWSDARLFVDGCTNTDAASYEREFGLEVTARHPLIRTFGNWTLALGEIFLRNPKADRFLVVQDDAIFVKNLRRYLECCHYPSKSFLNCYLFPENQRLAPRIGQTARFYEGWYKSNQKGRGAVALVFSNEAVRALFSNSHMADRPLDDRRGHRNVDGGIVTGLKKAGYSEYVHSPALCQHIGQVSSMGSRPHPTAENFPGADYDAMDLLRNPDRIPPAV
jgi:hypothetical protein